MAKYAKPIKFDKEIVYDTILIHMASEFEALEAQAREIEQRAVQGDFPSWASEAGNIAQRAGQLAQLIRELKGPEYFVEPTSSEASTGAESTVGQATGQKSIIPNFYIKKPVEDLTLPSPDQLVSTSREQLKAHFGIDVEVPTPPVALFETLEAFALRKIRNFDEVFYLPAMRLDKGHKFWRGNKVKPEDYFWNQIKEGNYPAHSAELEAGWYIGDRRGKPQYNNGQQMYEDDYLAPLMVALRSAGKVERYGRVPEGSRFWVSPREIEDVILPAFKDMSGAQGIVRNRRHMTFNVWGNMAHPEWGITTTWEWFGDPAYAGAYRLIGGHSDVGGLAYVYSNPVDYRYGHTAFSPEVFFPSQAK